jgi:hypothetical protein
VHVVAVRLGPENKCRIVDEPHAGFVFFVVTVVVVVVVVGGRVFFGEDHTTRLAYSVVDNFAVPCDVESFVRVRGDVVAPVAIQLNQDVV